MPFVVAAAVLAALAGMPSCSTFRASSLEKKVAPAQIALGERMRQGAPLQVKDSTRRDTLVVHNIDGRDMLVMRAVRDDDGKMVANQVLEAARVTATFRNVAERHGRIDLGFRIIVPKDLMGSRWQLRYRPTMYMLGDSVALERVNITGKEYRRRQLRGYQQYQKFLDRIIGDSTYFVRRDALEIFLRRNIPAIYAFRRDSSFVSDSLFYSAFGVSDQEAVEHYTDWFALHRNSRRIAMKDRMYRKYVKAPFETSGVRLDTVVTADNGDCIFEYTQTIATRPKLRKVEIVLDGDIYEQDRRLCQIGRSAPLSYYISSVSAFADDSPHYITRIISRRAQADVSYNIDFRSGQSTVDPDLGENAARIREVKENLRSLMANDIFELDSIIITASASPEGSFKANSTLSGRRSQGVCRYFEDYMRSVRDSLARESGFSVSVDGDMASTVHGHLKIPRIKFISSHIGEDWAALDGLVRWDSSLSDSEKASYDALRRIPDPDAREAAMAGEGWYRDVRGRLYPQLRRVRFSFNMHRRGMVKDTVHTTVVDSVYMEGVQAIKDRDYDRAIEILRPYNDYNTAVAYCAKDFNHSALSILKDAQPTAQVDYMLALIHARLGDERSAVELYLRSCSRDSRFVHRGNLDPEISALIKEFNLTF